MGFGPGRTRTARPSLGWGMAAAGTLLLALAGCGGPAGAAAFQPAPSAGITVPVNVSAFLTFAYTGSNAAGYSTHSVEHIVEAMTGEQRWFGSNTLPGSAAVSAPNAQGAVLFTWNVGGQRFQWLVSQNGQYAVPENARSRQALGG